MAIEKVNEGITPDMNQGSLALAEFISTETTKSDSAVNESNWLIFERYNREFNAIARRYPHLPTAVVFYCHVDTSPYPSPQKGGR